MASSSSPCSSSHILISRTTQYHFHPAAFAVKQPYFSQQSKQHTASSSMAQKRKNQDDHAAGNVADTNDERGTPADLEVPPPEQASTNEGCPPKKKRKSLGSKETPQHMLAQQSLHDSIRPFALEAFEELVVRSGRFPLNIEEENEEEATPSSSTVNPLEFEEFNWVEYGKLASVAQNFESTDDEVPGTPLTVEDVNESGDISLLFNNLVFNLENTSKELVVDNERGVTALVPPQSTFLMSDIENLKPLASVEPFDLVLIDPPWPNKSAKRAKKYHTLDKYDLFKLPVKSLSRMYVAVWVTNKPKYVQFTKEKLFPAWNLELVGEWVWLKVTTRGEWVMDLDR
ncbi:Methyltransferase-like protein 4 [Quaeritorhiza haematococci]|nr:Methyltransferase-like protein 4 [Quaeritorhiza haematococci]